MKLYAFILLLLFNGSISDIFPQTKWKWEKLNYTFEKDVILLSTVSENNFWVKTLKGDLYHCLNGDIFYYKTIIPAEYTRITATAISNDKFIFSAMDNNWKTHFFHFENGLWKRDNFVFRLPIQEIAIINEGFYYAIGNFGTMLLYKNKQWHEIETPLKSHIYFINVISPKEIYLTTNAEGIFLFDGNNFRNIPFEDEKKWDITLIKVFNRDKIYALDSKQNIYRLIENKFIQDPDKRNKAIFTGTDNIAYFESVLKTEHKDFLPILIPSIYRFTSYKSYHADSLLFTHPGGTIYKAYISHLNYFSNLNRVYGIKSNDFTYNFFAAITDINNNTLPDIITFNRGIKTGITYFYNTPSSPFRTNSSPAFEVNKTIGQSAAFLDYNNDGFVDFIINISDTSGNYLHLYENDRHGNFYQKKTILLPEDNILRTPASLKPVDINADGKMDLCVSYYYGPLDKTGYMLILKNSFLNSIEEIDTSFKQLTQGWNTQPIFADFTGNNQIDIYLTNKWRNNKLFINNNGVFTDESETRFDSLYLTETQGASAADFNNDGFLDILTVSDKYFLQLFQNDGKGYFTDVTSLFGLDKFSSIDSVFGNISLVVADFNNDSWLDIFAIDFNINNPRNMILINQNGKSFTDLTEEMQITTPVLFEAIAADIDNDGDIDIFSFGYNDYALWINNQNDNNYIKIKPRGIISNAEGWGAKIWIYESGFLNNKQYLRGYKQLGSEIFGNVKSIDNVAHFGVNENYLYDVKIKFHGGKEIILSKLKPGNFYFADELTGFSAFMYNLPGVIYQTISSREIQYYLLTTLLTFFILYSGIRIGSKKFRWDLKLSLGFVVVSISIYWLIIILTINTESLLIKYLLPLSAASAGIVIPNIVFLWISMNQSKIKSIESISDELLHELMQFSHGAWALSNLNSLQLLYQHAPENKNDKNFDAALKERSDTFKKMVLPKLLLIQSLSESIGISNDVISNLKQSIKIINEQFNKTNPSYILLTQSVTIIKNALGIIKKKVYQSYSCNPVEVIKKTCESLDEIILQNDVILQRNKFYEGTKFVLIKNYELADILDNCLQNAVKAIADQDKKEISINVYKHAPKICIDIIDSGIGIEENEWDKIFESGYSKGAGTGQGLFYARETLKKYGARIYVKSSSQPLETIFTIELNEGIEN